MSLAFQRPVRTLLIVDDEESIVEMMSRITESMGYRAIGAANVEQAIASINSASQPHAILCDVNMAGMNGIDFLIHLRSQCNDIPFVFFTGFMDKENLIQAVRLGATDFLSKPCDQAEIQTVIDRVLDIGVRQWRIRHCLDQLKRKSPEVAAELEDIEQERKKMTKLGILNAMKRGATPPR